MPIEYALFFLFIMIIAASFKAYHELRMVRLKELYEYIPEANMHRIFRIFFNLYKDGEFLKSADTKRRQEWDEDVIKALMDYCGDGAKNNYLLGTRRRWGVHGPLSDENYDKAVSIIRDIVFSNDFGGRIRLR